jgi:hypothetical protein
MAFFLLLGVPSQAKCSKGLHNLSQGTLLPDVTTPQAKALGLLGVQAAIQPVPGIVAPIPKYLN